MKQKDIVYAALAAIIFVVAGIIGVTQLAPKKANTKSNQVEVIQRISDSFDRSAYKELVDPTKSRDYGVTFDLTTGLNNASPFGN